MKEIYRKEQIVVGNELEINAERRSINRSIEQQTNQCMQKIQYSPAIIVRPGNIHPENNSGNDNNRQVESGKRFIVNKINIFVIHFSFSFSGSELKFKTSIKFFQVKI